MADRAPMDRICDANFLVIRYVYRQGWFFSLFKFLFGGFVYLIVLVFALASPFSPRSYCHEKNDLLLFALSASSASVFVASEHRV